MRSHILIVLFIVAVMAYFADNRVQSSESEEDKQFYCGRRLAKTLAMLCENGLLVKRAEPVYNFLLSHEGQKPMQQQYDWPWMPPHKARTMERGKRQAASECCDKPCSLPELLGYCAR